MKISSHSALYTARFAPQSGGEPPQDPPKDPEDGFSVDWKRTGRAALYGAAYAGIGSVTAQFNAGGVANLAAAVSSGLTAGVTMKNPSAFLGGMLIGHVGFVVSRSVPGPLGAVLGAGAGGLMIGLSDLSNQMQEGLHK